MTRVNMTKREMEDLHSVLRRAAERAERRRAAGDPSADSEAEMLARAVAELNDELART